jgi:hypothetical protein
MSRMGIQVLHDQGLGRYYPSGLFRHSGQNLPPARTQIPDRAECGVVNLEHHLLGLLGEWWI